LIKLFEINDFQRNDYFFEIGNRNKYIGFLCSGVLRLFILDKEGNENNLFFSVENDFVIGNLTPNMKCSFNAQALVNSIVLVADYKEYNDLITQHQQLTEFHENILGDIHNKIRDRITKDFFNNSKKNYQTFLSHYPGLLNRIPHHYIASYLGITPTQLSRIRKKISE
jgi:CRP-like cAMP-binding protein